MTRKPAPDADSLSVALAGRYAGPWARRVVRRAEEAGRSATPWFVDGFAGADLQRAALRSAAPEAAALAAIRALDEAVPGGARIVLVEEDPGLLARLCDDLADADVADRIRVAADPATAGPGEIVLIEAPFASVAASLASGIGGEPALVRLAPLAARTLPWTAVQPLAGLPATDVLLRVPLEDFAKQARFASPLADLPPHIRRVVDGCSALLGDARHAWLSPWREAQRTSPDAANATVIERMQVLLAGAADERTIRPLRLDGGGGPVHLILSSSQTEHAEEFATTLSGGAAAAKPESAATDTASKRKRGSSRKSSASADEAAAEAAPATAADVAPAADPIEPPAEPSADAAGVAPPAEPPVAEPSGEAATIAADAAPAADPPAADLPAVEPPADSSTTADAEPAAPADAEPAAPTDAAVLDLFAADVGTEAGPRDADTPRAAAPRPKKKREPAAEMLGLFDEPEE